MKSYAVLDAGGFRTKVTKTRFVRTVQREKKQTIKQRTRSVYGATAAKRADGFKTLCYAAKHVLRPANGYEIFRKINGANTKSKTPYV